MAKWVLYENRRQNLTLLYRNVVSGEVFQCGELRADTPANLVVDWVMNQDAVRPGDLIKLADGSVLQVLSPGAQA